MDAIDEQIIALLSVDGRMSATEIGKRVHRSRVAVMHRIESLVAKGEITGFGISLRKKACPVLFEVVFRVNGSCDLLMPKFQACYPINKAWSVAGASDLFIWTEANTLQDIHLMRSFLAAQWEVARITTHAVSSTFD